mmetsp:Transcript_36903/g.66368  ORF Transcript_36903/g.66368 Transcript_36903/m.66368 type:complete len:92 (+) Transcript_36903:253-528(+)
MLRCALVTMLVPAILWSYKVVKTCGEAGHFVPPLIIILLIFTVSEQFIFVLLDEGAQLLMTHGFCVENCSQAKWFDSTASASQSSLPTVET